jgi:hypothetical protein
VKTFKSITDVEQLRNHAAYAPLHATIEKLVVPVIAARCAKSWGSADGK